MLVKVFCAAIQGINAVPVYVEVHLSRGIKFSLVGLPDNAVRESHERVISALQENGMDIPRKNIVINMSPADLKKEGSSYDLPIAIGMITAGEYIPEESIKDTMFAGELSLDGKLKKIKGALSITILAKKMKLRRIILPTENEMEAAAIPGIEVIGIDNLSELRNFLNGSIKKRPAKPEDFYKNMPTYENIPDFEDVKGQEEVKRAVEVACAGFHNIIMIGPPGAGKTMIANCIPGILPPMNIEEAIETTKIHSVAGKISSYSSLIKTRPFQAPHHSISAIALTGGGSIPHPGQISLAHNGVLYMDELPEFKREVLEILRQPLEEGKIRISRAKYNVEYPASFMFVASMNPCPCGYYNHPSKDCVCSPGEIKRYLNKISGPLLDRIDIQMEIIPVPFAKLSNNEKGESSKSIRKRIIAAREIQRKRFKNNPYINYNSQMGTKEIEKYVKTEKQGIALLKTAMNKLNLSARAYSRILKVSRTIADLDNTEKVLPEHIAEAIKYRTLDKDHWGE